MLQHSFIALLIGLASLPTSHAGGEALLTITNPEKDYKIEKIALGADSFTFKRYLRINDEWLETLNPMKTYTKEQLERANAYLVGNMEELKVINIAAAIGLISAMVILAPEPIAVLSLSATSETLGTGIWMGLCLLTATPVTITSMNLALGALRDEYEDIWIPVHKVKSLLPDQLNIQHQRELSNSLKTLIENKGTIVIPKIDAFEKAFKEALDSV